MIKEATSQEIKSYGRLRQFEETLGLTEAVTVLEATLKSLFTKKLDRLFKYE